MENIESHARNAAAGDKAALEAFVRAIRDDVYGLCLRMLGHPADAEDATQEILIKVVTHLSSFRGESGIRTWIWRIAKNHILSARRSPKEPEGLSFEAFEEMVAAGLDAGLDAPATPEAVLLEEEVKLGCTQAMLMCLDREHRLAFLLGEVLELDGEEGAAILEVEPTAFRKRVSRARERIRAFMDRNCGLVSEQAPCRCRKQIAPSLHAGMIDPKKLVYAIHPVRAQRDPSLWKTYRAIEGLHRSVEVFRSHPDYAAPDSMVSRFQELLARI